MDFVRSHFTSGSTIQVPFCEGKSVQLVRVAFFRSDFLQNPYFSRKMRNYWHTWLSEKIALRSCIWTCLSSIFRRPFLTACTEVGRTRPCLTFLYVFSSILSFLQTWFTVDVTLCSKVKGLWAEKRTEFCLLEIIISSSSCFYEKKLRVNRISPRKSTSGA